MSEPCGTEQRGVVGYAACSERHQTSRSQYGEGHAEPSGSENRRFIKAAAPRFSIAYGTENHDSEGDENPLWQLASPPLERRRLTLSILNYVIRRRCSVYHGRPQPGDPDDP